MGTATKRILVATDLSEVSAPLLAYAVGLARQFDAELVALHVFNPQTYHEVLGDTGMAVDQYVGYLRAEMRYQLDEAGGGDVPAQLEVLEGWSIPEQILATASRQRVDLIVLGTHARTGLRRAFLGSVAEAVLRHARCPVLVLPTSVLAVWRQAVAAAS